MSIGAIEIVIVLAIALLVFGPERLPQMGRTLGRGLREFRKATEDITGTFPFTDDEPSPDDAGATPAPLDPTAARDDAEAALQEPAKAQEPAGPAGGGPGDAGGA
jgi:sec-independent protein translocase protein TatA